MTMTSEQVPLDGGQMLKIAGRVDGATAPQFETALLGLFAEGSERVLLDLSALDYVSSAGLRVILMAAKKARARQGRLVLCALQPQVDEVFQMSGFARILDIAPSADEGQARLAA